MGKPLLEERKITDTIEKLPGRSFTILDFMARFRRLFPGDWQTLVRRYRLFGEKRRYTVATYLANRLYVYSQKSKSRLKPFRKYSEGGKGDYRRATKEERQSFGSPWTAVYRKR